MAGRLSKGGGRNYKIALKQIAIITSCVLLLTRDDVSSNGDKLLNVHSQTLHYNTRTRRSRQHCWYFNDYDVEMAQV